MPLKLLGIEKAITKQFILVLRTKKRKKPAVEETKEPTAEKKKKEPIEKEKKRKKPTKKSTKVVKQLYTTINNLT